MQLAISALVFIYVIKLFHLKKEILYGRPHATRGGKFNVTYAKDFIDEHGPDVHYRDDCDKTMLRNVQSCETHSRRE